MERHDGNYHHDGLTQQRFCFSPDDSDAGVDTPDGLSATPMAVYQR